MEIKGLAESVEIPKGSREEEEGEEEGEGEGEEEEIGRAHV